MHEEPIPPLKSALGGSGASETSSPAADPLDALAANLGDEPEQTAGQPASAPPALTPEAYQPVAEYVFGVVEAFAVGKWGEPMRASDKQRAAIVKTGADALAVYAPAFLTHPAAPFGMAFLLGWFLPNIQRAKKEAAARATTATDVPTPRPPPAPAWRGASPSAPPPPQPDHAGGGWEGQGQEHLGEG
jgi:hypothetical protein